METNRALAWIGVQLMDAKRKWPGEISQPICKMSWLLCKYVRSPPVTTNKIIGIRSNGIIPHHDKPIGGDNSSYVRPSSPPWEQHCICIFKNGNRSQICGHLYLFCWTVLFLGGNGSFLFIFRTFIN